MKRTLTLGGILLLVLMIGSWPSTAEAQARGTLQATARVVDTRPAASALETAREAIRALAAGRPVHHTAATVAQVSVARPVDRPAVVVTIDYSRN